MHQIKLSPFFIISLFLFGLSLYQIECRQSHSRPTQGCRLNITNGTAGANTPVVLNGKPPHLSLAVPNNGSINLKTHTNLVLLCPGSKNTIVNVDSNESEAVCEMSNTIKISDSYYSFDHLQCAKPISADVKDPETTCGSRGKELYIGYKLHGEKKQDFVELIKVCYDLEEGIPLYTEHVLHGEAIKYASKSTVRPSFSTQGLGPDVAAVVAYKKAFQKSTFNSLLQSTRLADKYINMKSFIATGHLSPHGDFLLTSSQRSTYFYINACPQWQAINNGNWKSLESAVRKTAEHYNKSLMVLTGTYDVLTLRDNNNKPTKIYLHKKVKLPVPKYTWKILYDLRTEEGVALIVYNNPFGKESDDVEFCNNICEDYGWGKDTWRNFKKGYVFCCSVSELRESVSFVPYFQVNSILHGVI